ncbi:head-tail connector protein [Herbaspirillum sp. AP02]|uniref:portal protein n=1 Tax=unclassified Herbaspirillum TaxID=2624150 RepID=UPI0015D9ACD2|nr:MULTISPECIES: portal protein [unclassified Herbaspirillum]MBG7619338.1 head-tail connector protein [Herbaspirillum sp. AP02]NZD66622.1 head-tail connector protein [Herbaspirillum sp. AP21]
MDRASAIIRRRESMRSARSIYEQNWKDGYDYSFPERGDGFYGEQSDGAALAAKRARLFDSTATDSGQILAASIMTGGTPSNSRWVGLSTGNDTDEEKRWLDASAQLIWHNIHASNYDSEGIDACLDLVAAGWFVMFCDSPEEGGYHFQLLPMATSYIAASKPGGAPDILVHEYCLTAEQAVNKFGESNVSEKIRKCMEDNGNPDEKFKFVWSIYPRSSADQAGITAKNLPFASIHVEMDSKAVVKESGFHECPFWAPRYSKLPGTVYPVGPMYRAMPDVKQLNRLVYLEDMNADIAISGMWIAEDDGVLNPRTVKIGPRKIIVANSVDSMKSLASGANFNLSFTKKDALQASIRKILMADQLPPIDSPVRSATEFQLRVQQIRQVLGPIFGRLQPEWYGPMVARCFGLALRAGVLGRPPQSLAQRTITVVFNSPMAKSQKLEEVTAIESSLASINAIAAVDPTVLDTVDMDEAARQIMEGRGAPASISRPPEAVAQLREQRTQAQQQAQQQQQQHELAQKTVPIAMQQANK